MKITIFNEALEDFHISRPKVLCLGFKETSSGYTKTFKSVDEFYSLLLHLSLENTSSRARIA